MLGYDVVCDDRQDYSNGPHAHADDMLFVPLDGIFAVSSREIGRPAALIMGSMWWVPSRAVHHVTASPGQRHLCYYLDMPKLLATCRADFVPGQEGAHRWTMSSYLVDMLRLRGHFTRRRSSPNPISQVELDRAILGEIGRIVGTITPIQESQPEPVIYAVKTYIKNHMDADLSCGALAQRFQLSVRTLARWFQKVEGQPIGQYIQQQRLTHARDLLLSTSLPVGDVQLAVGFSSAQHFSYAMREAFGFPPRQLRLKRPLA